MRTRSSLVVICFAVVLSISFTGCFEIEQSLELDENMSGTADIMIGVDLEPMALIMATMQRQMEGKEGPPSEEELAKARAEMKAQNEEETEEAGEPLSLEEANADMPEGIRLLDMSVEEKGLQIVSRFKLAFDTLSHLVNFELPSENGQDAPGDVAVMESPFENLELIDEGDTFTIRSKPVNPTHDVEEQVAEQAPPDPEMEKMMKEAFKNLRFTWKIKAPFEVVSHNATMVDGDTLIWTYDLETFEELEAAGADGEDLEIRVSYRK
jgi:hypothetical protein